MSWYNSGKKPANLTASKSSAELDDGVGFLIAGKQGKSIVIHDVILGGIPARCRLGADPGASLITGYKICDITAGHQSLNVSVPAGKSVYAGDFTGASWGSSAVAGNITITYSYEEPWVKAPYCEPNWNGLVGSPTWAGNCSPGGGTCDDFAKGVIVEYLGRCYVCTNATHANSGGDFGKGQRPPLTLAEIGEEFFCVSGCRGWELCNGLGACKQIVASTTTNLRFALETSSVVEGNTGWIQAYVTVDRIGNMNGTATVDYATADGTATAGQDYTATSGTLSFAAGITSQTISITISGDTDDFGDETFSITLSNPTQTVGVASISGTNPHVVTIIDDDAYTVGFALATSSVAEGDSGSFTLAIAVTRSDANGLTHVDYATADGTATAGADYTATSGTLTFADGVSSMNVSVVISGDGTVENDEAFTITLTNAISQYGAAFLATNVHTVTITNDDTCAIGFNSATSYAAEGDSGASFTLVIAVERSDTNGTASVDYVTADGTAEAGTDYTATSGTLNFADGVSYESVDVTIFGDAVPESNETFTITLTNPSSQYGAASLATNVHTATITNDDVFTMGFSATTSAFAEGDSGSFTLALAVVRTETNGTASVDYATADGTAEAGTDYTATSGTLNFANGVSLMNVNVVISGDGANEDDETFTVTLTNLTSAYGGGSLATSVHTATITNDDTSAIGFAAATSSTTEGDSGSLTLALAVVRSDTNGTASVDYATADGTAEAGTDYTATSGTLNFANGVSLMNVNVVISGDTDYESNETLTVTLTNPTSQYGAIALATNVHTATITNDDTTTTTTTTSAGSYFRVEDCTTNTLYVIDDAYNNFPSLAVNDVVFWADATYTNTYCGTITATGVGGTSVGDIQGTEDFNLTPYACSTCNSDNGL